MNAHVVSDIGLVRESNEDNYIFMPPNLFVVADGMGGHLAGEIASKHAMIVMQEFLSSNSTHGDIALLLERSIHEANEQIYKLAVANKEYSGMGTTITAAFLDRKKLYWAHVGDSRLYQINESSIIQLTSDHSFVGELVKNGTINAEEARNHPQRNLLTRAIGVDSSVQIDTGTIELTGGDSILLCTDGLTNLVTDQTIYEIIRKKEATPVLLVEDLVNHAKAAGGHDNITVIWARIRDL